MNVTLARSWGDIEAGTLCRVKGRGISSAFRFLYVRTTQRETALTLYGPVKLDPRTGEGLPHQGVQGFISVRPELVSRWPVKTRRKRKRGD